MPSKTSSTDFDLFYQELYPENWDQIKKALLAEESQMIRSCFGAPKAKTQSDILGYPLYTKDYQSMAQTRNEKNLREYYIMDPASYLCADYLAVTPGDKVLDMCAAPGGKSLILAENMGADGELWANEISKSRRDRLVQVIRDYIPMELRENVFVKGKDAIKYGLIMPDTFDRVLLDAPCSSERHVLKNENELAKWGPKRTKKLATIQYGLLCSALLSCKPGGTIVYSTCSLSPLENDNIIEKLLKKKGDQVELSNLPVDYFDQTEFGQISLPHRHKIGPIYMARLKKKN